MAHSYKHEITLERILQVFSANDVKHDQHEITASSLRDEVRRRINRPKRYKIQMVLKQYG